MNIRTTKPLFKVFFNDNTIFDGGFNFRETKWLEIPFKNISKIHFLLPNGRYLKLEGYNKYFYMVEATRNIMGRSQDILRYYYIMGCYGDKIRIYKISLFNNENIKVGDMTQTILKENHNFIKGLNPNGWKKGV